MTSLMGDTLARLERRLWWQTGRLVWTVLVLAWLLAGSSLPWPTLQLVLQVAVGASAVIAVLAAAIAWTDRRTDPART